jgi:CBS domain-containing protein
MITMKVGDVMTTPVVSVRPEVPLKEVARLMVEHMVSGIPVVEADGRVVGVVSEADFLVKQRGAEAVRRRPLAWLLGESRATLATLSKVAAVAAREAMTSPAITIGADRPVREAADLMVERRVNRLPVVDAAGVLVGIVTRADIVRGFVRPDEELARVIRDEILVKALWMDPHEIDLKVTHGNAELRGTVDRRSTAEVLAHLAAQVDGVVSVTSELTWRLDDSRLEADKPDMLFPLTQR